MNTVAVRRSVCPHDCPSTCALEVEVLDERTIGRVRGAADNAYTAGVICAKVARYAERNHHPDRLMTPLARTGPKGSGQFREIGWDEALDRIADAFKEAAARHGPQAVWPYYYAGTMGQVQRDGINRLRHALGYSRMFDTICTNTAWTGWIAGTGRLAGPDPREMAKADVVVIWGTNAVSTQVNVMTHAIRARKTRGAKIVAVDVYRTETVKQADVGVILRPGTDAALACAIMHVAFRDGYADRDYLARFADCPEELEAHLATRDPAWAAAITGLSVEEIEAVAALIGRNRRTFLRLGYGFTRGRNGTVGMHAAQSIATVLGLWQYEGGGAFHNNGAIYGLNKTMIEGLDIVDPATRQLDQSRIGAILEGDPDVLFGGPPVTAMLIQNTNPMTVCPEQTRVRRGFAREDLFVAIHEQFMTDTARMADIVLPATTFVEHDDVYRGGGHQYILYGPKLVEAPGQCRTNHEVIVALAERLGAEHPGFAMSPREHIDWMLKASRRGSLAELEAVGWSEWQPPFEEAHYLNGFAYPDGKFRFKPDWTAIAAPNNGPMGPWSALPSLPDYWPVTEEATADAPFRLVTAPARSFLNTSFNETPSSVAKEGRPTVKIHPDDAAARGIAEGDLVRLFNARGSVRLHAEIFAGLKRGVLVTEGLWPNTAFVDGAGINTLTAADPVAPYGGVAFHDSRVSLEKG
ncbi:molybdopterin-containing oxidoreductase family protein [Segnochrobactrum spirostomi]|uniref:Molybdopterin oxidoreductase family protein n=1 Tax=Segnochrobactrum spirostomi TaxID=2608987 RepID=A0A6A7Y170_9HYPH|nr:molybdopterin oxidoreductase family protein [Segnochrobactrum spirostomi]MQT11669.1 molybdopterin oxidoreductase family protein [Segnochrobactrum spirostomi]